MVNCSSGPNGRKCSLLNSTSQCAFITIIESFTQLVDISLLWYNLGRRKSLFFINTVSYLVNAKVSTRMESRVIIVVSCSSISFVKGCGGNFSRHLSCVMQLVNNNKKNTYRIILPYLSQHLQIF